MARGRSGGRSIRQRLVALTPRSHLCFIILPTLVAALGVAHMLVGIRDTFYVFEMEKKCAWTATPPLICAHGGVTTDSVMPNTMQAYRLALQSRYINCMEIDVSRSRDGVLFAIHDTNLQKRLSNETARVGYMSALEIESLDGSQLGGEYHDQKVPTLEAALLLVSSSVTQVIIDAKYGPPFYLENLASDIVSVVERANCTNCMIWAKNDRLVLDVSKLRPHIKIGYVMMRNYSTNKVSDPLRVEGASCVGVSYDLLTEQLITILHGGGEKVYAWTVDEKASMQRMLAEGVDGIVTNHPSILHDLMKNITKECEVHDS